MANPVTQLADTKVGRVTVLDGFFIGSAKLASEQAFATLPYVRNIVGNGTLRSGAIKGASALALSMVTPKNGSIARATSYVYTGMLLDGMEDVVLGLRNWLGSRTGSSEEQVSVGFQ